MILLEKSIDKLIDAAFNKLNSAASEKNVGHVYVVDTNIIHGFPEAIEFLAQEYSDKKPDDPNIIVISDIVRRELNGLKKNQNIDKARDARIALKGLNQYLKEKDYDVLTENGFNIGVKFPKGSLLFLLPYSGENKKFPSLRSYFGGDDQIVSSALAISESLEEKTAAKVSIVSDDADMHTTCFQFGIPSSRFEEFYKDYDYKGIIDIDLEKAENSGKDAYTLHNKLSKGGDLTIDVGDIISLTEEEVHPNQFIRFLGEQVNPNKFFRIDNRKETLSNVFKNLRKFLRSQTNLNIKTGYTPTPQQECVLELLYDPSIDYVTLSGPPGGGKTMLPLDVGMTYLKEESIYSLVVANPPIEAQHGYLPGSKKEKLKIENQNIFDSLYFVMGANEVIRRKKADAEQEIFQKIEKGEIELETLTYIKGRTLNNRFILFDETEDYEPKQMRKLASRLGKKSKMVFSGDPYQVDNSRCSKTRNGLVYFISKFKGQSNYGHVTLQDISRSEGAKQSARLL